MPSIDCSISVAPETKEGDDFLKIMVALSFILIYNGLKIAVRRFHRLFPEAKRGK